MKATKTCPQCSGTGQIHQDIMWIRLSDTRFVFVRAPEGGLTKQEKQRVLEWVSLQLCVESPTEMLHQGQKEGK